MVEQEAWEMGGKKCIHARKAIIWTKKHQKPEVLTSSKFGELLNTPSERKDDFSNIVLTDKQQA